MPGLLSSITTLNENLNFLMSPFIVFVSLCLLCRVYDAYSNEVNHLQLEVVLPNGNVVELTATENESTFKSVSKFCEANAVDVEQFGETLLRNIETMWIQNYNMIKPDVPIISLHVKIDSTREDELLNFFQNGDVNETIEEFALKHGIIDESSIRLLHDVGSINLKWGFVVYFLCVCVVVALLFL